MAANRGNAKKSTGPKTSDGRHNSAMNSLKHGLLSSETLLPTEDPAAWATFSEGIRRDLNPVGEIESELADCAASFLWRLRRARNMEAGILSWRFHEVSAQRAAKKAATNIRVVPNMMDEVQRPTEVLNQAEYELAVAEQREHELAQESEITTLGEAVVQDSREGDALSTLWRYQASLERGLHRVLHELQRLQAARQGKPVPLPLAVDVHISGLEDPNDETTK
jgi:hypothetical protein